MALDSGFWGGFSSRYLWSKRGVGVASEWFGTVNDSSPDFWRFALRNTDNVNYRATDATNGVETEWHHIAMVATASTVRLLVDGANVGSAPTTTGTRVGNLSGPLAIGGYADNSTAERLWYGAMSLVSFHPADITDTRIGVAAAASSLDDYTTEVMADSPTAFWRMLERTLPIADYTGNGHTATAAGSGTFRTRSRGPLPRARGVHFDGDVYLSVSDASAWSSTEFTMMGWVCPGPFRPPPQGPKLGLGF